MSETFDKHKYEQSTVCKGPHGKKSLTRAKFCANKFVITLHVIPGPYSWNGQSYFVSTEKDSGTEVETERQRERERMGWAEKTSYLNHTVAPRHTDVCRNL